MAGRTMIARLFLLAGIALGPAAPPLAAQRPAEPRPDTALWNPALREMARFQSVDSAVARGYRREVKECLVHEHHGAMGYHHVNPRLVDGKLELEQPEILLYERGSDRSYRLVAAEYIVPFSAWPRDSTRLYLLEQPLKRDDNLRIWYLHVWAWKPNPEGMFANFHPDVKCPPGDAKVFRPTER